jgi:hypothetical protein
MGDKDPSLAGARDAERESVERPIPVIPAPRPGNAISVPVTPMNRAVEHRVVLRVTVEVTRVERSVVEGRMAADEVPIPAPEAPATVTSVIATTISSVVVPMIGNEGRVHHRSGGQGRSRRSGGLGHRCAEHGGECHRGHHTP